MEETLFYVLGIGLVVLALAASAVGLRWEGFPPSRGLFAAVALAFAALVIATGAFAWMSAAEEQEHREAELAEAAAAEGGEGVEEGGAGPAEDETAGTDAAETTTAAATAAADGAQVFESAGCTGCHTLAAAGSTAETGPNLDGALKGKSAKYIETSIVDPNDQIAEGYPPDVMPQDYEQRLGPEDLKALVQYLTQSAG